MRALQQVLVRGGVGCSEASLDVVLLGLSISILLFDMDGRVSGGAVHEHPDVRFRRARFCISDVDSLRPAVFLIYNLIRNLNFEAWHALERVLLLVDFGSLRPQELGGFDVLLRGSLCVLDDEFQFFLFLFLIYLGLGLFLTGGSWIH